MQPQHPFDPKREIEDGQPAIPVNPFQAEVPGLQPEFESPRHGEQPRRRRRWTSLAVPAVSFFGFVFCSGVMLIVALVVVHGRFDMALLRDPDR